MTVNKQKTTTVLLMSTLFLTLSACGEFSYKRGATATEFQQEKKSCSTEYTAEVDVESCLAKSGWIVVGVDKPLFAEATASTKNVETISEEKLIPEQAADPLELIAVGSWWKTGAAPNALLADSEQCVAELGEGHQTQNNMSLVTRGLIGCMRGKGWFALKQ
ncbi:MAG: hypothetical protein MUQ51_06785 [Pseudomonadota bacterium]|nr:hypothetical protein [Pseudomonadota bacterium]MDO7711305.1 hypothetical protein [Pseudomonadota bacterium]